MQVSFLTSAFPNGFTDDFIRCIREYYNNEGSFVFIASDFEQHSITEKYMNIVLRMFESNVITFDEHYIIDSRTLFEDAVKYIEKADIVWISGGDTLKQINYLKEYNLIQTLQCREGITIGMSAGAINMAKTVVLAKDANDNIPELSIYSGIGLVDINIEPHLDFVSEEHRKEIYEASHHTIIYGIYDNTFIKVVNEIIDIYGDYVKYESMN